MNEWMGGGMGGREEAWSVKARMKLFGCWDEMGWNGMGWDDKG